MPASAISAASVQNGTPTGSATPAIRPTSSANGWSGRRPRTAPGRRRAAPRRRRRSRAARARPARASRPGIVRRSPGEQAPRRVARVLLPALDQRGVQRAGADERVPVARLQRAGRAPPARRARDPSSRSRRRRGPAASRARRRPPSRSRSRTKPRWATASCSSVGSTTIAASARTRSSTACGADRAELLVGDGRHDQVAPQLRRLDGREHDRRHRALHVVRAAAVEPAVLDPRLGAGRPCRRRRRCRDARSAATSGRRPSRAESRSRSGARRRRPRPRARAPSHHSATNAAASASPLAPAIRPGLTESIATSCDASSARSAGLVARDSKIGAGYDNAGTESERR